MISDTLKRDIEEYASRLRHSSEFFRQATRGEVTPDSVAAYVANLHLLLQHTEGHMRLAQKRAMELERPRLAAFFEDKMREEKGHECWAANDMSTLAGLFALRSVTGRSPAITGLVDYLSEAIVDEPTRYVAYILLAEYVTVLVGADLLMLLRDRCGIPSGSVTVVERHVELDGEHVAEGLHEIDSLVQDEKYLSPMQQTMRRSMQYFDSFWDEMSAGIAGRKANADA
jgi:hypothetical protein